MAWIYNFLRQSQCQPLDCPHVQTQHLHLQMRLYMKLGKLQSPNNYSYFYQNPLNFVHDHKEYNYLFMHTLALFCTTKEATITRLSITLSVVKAKFVVMHRDFYTILVHFTRSANRQAACSYPHVYQTLFVPLQPPFSLHLVCLRSGKNLKEFDFFLRFKRLHVPRPPTLA